ncbi:MAG: hypothetical protein OEW58_07680 [Gammaproteobacteria bacterium]|nr:hypothetical protein [Gammaproteobacteria bacterium]
MRRSSEQRKYIGLDKDTNQGMTATGRIIRDAWVFGLIPEGTTCEGWLIQGIEDLWGKVNAEWEKYGFLVSSLPPELLERHTRIHADAFEKAKQSGWDPDTEIAAED